MEGGYWRRGRAEGSGGGNAAHGVEALEAVVGEDDVVHGAAEGLEAALGVVGRSEGGEGWEAAGFDAPSEDVVCFVGGVGVAGDVPVKLHDGG